MKKLYVLLLVLVMALCSCAESSDPISLMSTTQQSVTQNIPIGRAVYKTPTGKRYHFLASCAGKNATETTIDSAKSAGLTPCQKCAK